jgi:basic membrane protein A
VAALVLSGCGNRGNSSSSSSGSPSDTASSSSAAPEHHPNFKACMVSDVGGFNDKSFNQTSYAGLQSAVKDLGVKSAKVQSTSPTEYADNINALVKQGCKSITTVGYTLADATLAAAKKNPKIDFSIVDFAYINSKGKNTAPKNLKGLTFDTTQPSYLAGYLAAGMTKSGVVGTFGGQNIPTVTSYMTGFQLGVDKYNADNNDKVQVIGWDQKSGKGSFTNSFTDKAAGQDTAEGMITQGADIIFPVAGLSGLGGLQAVKDKNLHAIWVDTDGCVSAAQYCSQLLTSATKGLDVAVENAIKSSVDGNFNNTPYVGTLANGGVGLAPYHQAQIPSSLQSKVDQLKQQIVSGSLKVQ